MENGEFCWLHQVFLFLHSVIFVKCMHNWIDNRDEIDFMQTHTHTKSAELQQVKSKNKKQTLKWTYKNYSTFYIYIYIFMNFAVKFVMPLAKNMMSRLDTYIWRDLHTDLCAMNQDFGFYNRKTRWKAPHTHTRQNKQSNKNNNIRLNGN